ncbi:hypothetical protein CAPTEDRAFT_181469 [Capitella teleta]|uniref:Neurotransmitter-gated ion-channel ligand-binding domain-containing protein n=1 Tax=Capitella teleta TaxID=283909 RepID=R7UTT4_CAPTE|nr:hypothetical protein CAPTEDRAFT_181469 [Capitella teleta]|eukprot:ELU09565.1 hypothetical protein CAPTEDRAFT_181469 [Capitella teleta]
MIHVHLLVYLTGLPRHYKQSDEEKLLDYLFADYNPTARPVINSSHTVTVGIQFSLIQIQELNVRSQVFTTTGLLIFDWEDERLVWNEDISPLDEIVISGETIWRPEFAAINGAEEIYRDYTEFRAVLKSSGKIRWEPGGVFKTMCQIDITYYPFDSQICSLTFGAWSYYTTKMNLTTNSQKVNRDTYEENGEWQIENTDVIRREFAFECCQNQRFSNVEFRVFLRRRHTFYIMNVILPGILTSATLLSIFFCTPSQKVHIGVASLLSFRLFMLNVADTIPRTSDHVPLLGIYLMCTMAITTLAMVATVFVLNLYSMKEKPVPPWAKRFFVDYLSRVLCMCKCFVPPEESGLNSPSYEKKQRDKYAYRLVTVKNQDETNVPPPSMPSPALRSNNIIRERRRMESPPPPQPRAPSTSSPSKSNAVDYNKEWVHVAAVCDRLFFWLCLLFIVATTLMLFHPLSTSKLF